MVDLTRLSSVSSFLRPLVFGMVLTAGSTIAADYELGQRAYDIGDYQTALKEWQPLAEAGDAQAQYALGFMHEYGREVARDDVRAAEWFLKAAEQGHPSAQYRLGVLYENGWGVDRDPQVAAEWYGRAAEQRHPFAQHDLAFMHLEGEGLPKDKVQAYKWLRIATELRADLMAKHLAMVSKTLSLKEIEEGEALVQAWFEQQN